MGSNPQVPLADGNEDGRLCDGVGVEVVELHAIVVRERLHEPIRRDAEAALVKGDEAHDVAVARPRLWLAVQSDPLWLGGVRHRTKESAVDERLECLHGNIGRIPGVRLDNNDVADHECDGGIGCGGEFFSLSHALTFSHFLPSSLFSLVLPGTRCSSDGSMGAELTQAR